MSLEEQIRFIDAGKLSYAKGWKLQQDLIERRAKGEIPDTVVFAEHPPTITLGSDDKWNVLHVSEKSLQEQGIDFAKSTRGGGAAYLGPGQLIGYVIIDLNKFGGPLNFLRALEDVMISTTKDFGIEVTRQDSRNPTTDKLYRATWYMNNGQPHVLCTKGIGVRLSTKPGAPYVSHHGFSMYINKETDYFHLIDPCGFPASEVTPISMSQILGNNISIDQVKEKIKQRINEIFSQRVQQCQQ